jgi:transcriptional regulator with XRE-family HTH domain
VNVFQHTLKQLLKEFGRTETQVARLGQIDRSYLTQLVDGEKTDPSLETLMRIWIGLIADEELAKKKPYLFEQGLHQLVYTAALSNAPLKLAVGKLEKRRKSELQPLPGD